MLEVTEIAKPKPSKRLIQEVQTWADEELEDLAAMIQGLLESRYESLKDAIEETREDSSPLGIYKGQGHIEKMIPDGKTGKIY